MWKEATAASFVVLFRNVPGWLWKTKEHLRQDRVSKGSFLCFQTEVVARANDNRLLFYIIVINAVWT